MAGYMRPQAVKGWDHGLLRWMRVRLANGHSLLDSVTSGERRQQPQSRPHLLLPFRSRLAAPATRTPARSKGCDGMRWERLASPPAAMTEHRAPLVARLANAVEEHSIPVLVVHGRHDLAVPLR